MTRSLVEIVANLERAREPRQKPMLFSTDLVRAILSGRKRVTRRPIKPDWLRCLSLPEDKARVLERAPWQSGDELWVRETWYCDDYRYKKEPADPSIVDEFRRLTDYLASHECRDWEAGCPCTDSCWRPSIHMPRWAARIFLPIIDVRIERLQDMGFESWRRDFLVDAVDEEKARASFTGHRYQREHTKRRWDAIYGKKFPYENNPWVWVIEWGSLRRTDT